MMLTSVGVVLFLLCGYKKEWGRVCLKVFFRRSFDKRKDMAVFCIGKMFDRNSLKFIVNSLVCIHIIPKLPTITERER